MSVKAKSRRQVISHAHAADSGSSQPLGFFNLTSKCRPVYPSIFVNRERLHTNSAMPPNPEKIIEVVPQGDALLVLDGVRLCVSTHALSLASPVFKVKLSSEGQGETSDIVLALPEKGDDAEAMILLCWILHLRNDSLPLQVSSNALLRLGILARTYGCVVAASRATAQWFDQLYNPQDAGVIQSSSDIWQIIEAAYVWDDAIYFVRFTSKWILHQSLSTKAMATASSLETQKLAWIMSERLSMVQMDLRADVDALVEPCALSFSEEGSHYIDYPPGLSPSASETPSGQLPPRCYVDREGAADYLGALRDNRIWPSTCWKSPNDSDGEEITVGDLVERIKLFKEPQYDDADRCGACIPIKEHFTEQLDTMKDAHAKRLMGLCLDCYKTAVGDKRECRYQHAK